jgi:hypothetical protein
MIRQYLNHARNVPAYCGQLSVTKKKSFARFGFDRKKTNYLKTEFQVKKEKTQDKAKICKPSLSWIVFSKKFVLKQVRANLLRTASCFYQI